MSASVAKQKIYQSDLLKTIISGGGGMKVGIWKFGKQKLITCMYLPLIHLQLQNSKNQGLNHQPPPTIWNNCDFNSILKLYSYFIGIITIFKFHLTWQIRLQEYFASQIYLLTGTFVAVWLVEFFDLLAEAELVCLGLANSTAICAATLALFLIRAISVG